jgi:hypothetical protein
VAGSRRQHPDPAKPEPKKFAHASACPQPSNDAASGEWPEKIFDMLFKIEQVRAYSESRISSASDMRCSNDTKCKRAE